MKKRQNLYVGKAKSLYSTDDKDFIILSFRDDISAFDGAKIEQLSRKGEINNKFNAFIMDYLKNEGIPTHFEKLINANEALVRNMRMMPVECVVRNIASGSLCIYLGIDDGMKLHPPVFEFFLKNDTLHDPMINESHIETFGWAKTSDQFVALCRITCCVWHRTVTKK